jgi:hypothetical protein
MKDTMNTRINLSRFYSMTGFLILLEQKESLYTNR